MLVAYKMFEVKLLLSLAVTVSIKAVSSRVLCMAAASCMDCTRLARHTLFMK